jgi:ribosomal protein S27AE
VSIYREGEPRCPTCASPLRDHQQRLVCDHCQAMLIADADFVRAVDELAGGGAQLAVFDVLDDERPCPRCGGPASTCRLSIGPTVLADRYLRCVTHGMWLPQSAMADVFARASRRAHVGAGGARTYGGVATLPSMPGGGMTGAMRSIAGAFGAGEPATSNLGINSGVGISHVHTVFVSAYKNRALACPTCASSALEFQGDRWACATCGGAFVETAALAGMVEDITGEPFELHEPKGAASPHACPVCTAPMVADELEARAIERCPEHGVWFSAHVLAAVLEHAASPEPHHGWLYRLLHRKE